MTLADLRLDATDRAYMVHPLAERRVMKVVEDGLVNALTELAPLESDEQVVRQAKRDLRFVRAAIANAANAKGGSET